MLKLPDFMRIDPNDFNAENIRRMSSYGKPQEDFLTGAVQQFQNSDLFKERKIARELKKCQEAQKKTLKAQIIQNCLC